MKYTRIILLILNNKWCSILLCFLLINNLQAQDCSSLRKPNETYGAGDTNVSWCAMTSKTPYTQCMCEQEKANKLSASEKQNLQQQALSKSTKASALYQQAHNLAIQANSDKDPSKLEEAETLYQQAINLSNEAKEFIEQAYAGSNPSYNNLKKLYLEQYNKQIEWATTGIESIAGQKDRIKAEINQKQITLRPTTTNSWDLSTKADNSWASNEAQEEEQSNESDRNEMDNWTQEETIRWLQSNLVLNHFSDYYLQSYIGFAFDYFILKNFWRSPSGDNEVYQRDRISVNNFRELTSIELPTLDMIGDKKYYQMILRFGKCACIKSYQNSRLRNPINDVRTILQRDTFEKVDRNQLINAFVHLAVLNGADKGKIEIKY